MSVTVIGDAFIDLIVPIYGIRRGETYYRKVLISYGGTANVAIQISKLGERAKFLGKVGKDIFGKLFKENLRKNGVKDLTVIDNRNPTGICISLVMIADRGANDFLRKEDVSSCIDDIVNSKIVYFSGYPLLSEQSYEAVMYAIKKCYGKCDVYFNPGAPNIINDKFRELIRGFVDVLILNEDEAKTLSGKEDLREALNVLNDLADLVVVTKGKEGCIVLKDAFAAGFIVGKLRGLDDIECAKMGNETAVKFLREKMEALR